MPNASPTLPTNPDDLYAPGVRVTSDVASQSPATILEQLDPIEREVFESNRRAHERLVIQMSRTKR